MKLIKGVATVILTVIFSMTLLLFIVIGTVNKTVSKNNLLEKLKNNNAYEEIVVIAGNIAETYIEGNPELDVYEEFLADENIENLVDSFVEKIYTDSNFIIDDDSFEVVLKDNINEIIDKNDIEITDEQEDELDLFVNEITEEFNIEDTFSNDSSASISNGIPIIIQMFEGAYKMLIIALVILLIITLVINSSNIWTGLKFLSSGVIVTGAFLVIYEILIKKSDVIKDFFLSEGNPTIMTIFKDVFYGALQLIKTSGIFCITLGFAVVIVSVIIEYLKKTNKKVEVLK